MGVGRQPSVICGLLVGCLVQWGKARGLGLPHGGGGCSGVDAMTRIGGWRVGDLWSVHPSRPLVEMVGVANGTQDDGFSPHPSAVLQ